MVSLISDPVLEIFRTLVILAVILYLWLEGEGRAEFARSGWRLIFSGFLLLLFGSAIDITDNFESLNRFVFIGDTEIQAFLEKMVGFIGGFLLLSIGLMKWIPTVTSVEKSEELNRELDRANIQLKNEVYERQRAEKYLNMHKNSLEKMVEKRTSEIVAVNEQLRQEIDEKKKAEEALKKSEMKYRMIFNNSPIGIFYLDRDGIITHCNEEFSRIIGTPKEILTGFNLMESSDDKKLKAAIEKAFIEGSGYYEGDYTSLTNGRTIPIKAAFNGDYAEDGTFLGGICTIEDITMRKKAEEVYKKELLLKEIHHRVKNNLQVISSLLSLQSRGFDDNNVVDAFKESQNRVRSMAIAHEKLYKSEDLDNIDFADYIKNLTTHLFYSYRVGHANVRLATEIDSFHLGIETVVPLGLILNELVTNSLKYAFSEGQEGVINIDFHQDDDICTLVIGDNGVGLSEDIDFMNTSSLGLQVVTTLVEQIDGTIELDSSNGTTFIIKFNV